MGARPTLRAPFDGVLVLPDGAIRCFVTRKGASYLSAKGVVRALTGEAMTTWEAFVRSLPGGALPAGDDALVSVRPKRGPAVDAVPATLLPDLCRHLLDACAATDAPDEAARRRAVRSARVLELLCARGRAALARGGAAAGGAS